MRWTTNSYLSLIESGIVPETRWIELVDGQIVESMPQGELHQFIFLALQKAFAAMGAFSDGLAVQPTVRLTEGNVFDPEFAFLVPTALRERRLPVPEEVRMVIEVAVTSKAYDLGAKRAAYAAAGIPAYWVFDGPARGVWVHSSPVAGQYSEQSFLPADQEARLPMATYQIDLDSIFPTE